MYTLIQNDTDPFGLNDIFYKTPCGSNVLVASVRFGPSPEDTLIVFPEGMSTAKAVSKIMEVIAAHQS